MTTPTGQISMADVNVELGRSSTTQIRLGDTDVRELAGTTTGPISLNDLRGVSADMVVYFVVTFTNGPNSQGPYSTLNLYFNQTGQSQLLIYQNNTPIAGATPTVPGNYTAWNFSGNITAPQPADVIATIKTYKQSNDELLNTGSVRMQYGTGGGGLDNN